MRSYVDDAIPNDKIQLFETVIDCNALNHGALLFLIQIAVGCKTLFSRSFCDRLQRVSNKFFCWSVLDFERLCLGATRLYRDI